MNSNNKVFAHKTWGVVALIMSILFCSLSASAATVSTGTYPGSGSSNVSGHVSGGKLNIWINNSATGTLKTESKYVNPFKPGVAVVDVSGYNLNSLTETRIQSGIGPSDAYATEGKFGLLIFSGGTNGNGALQWDIKNFDSSQASKFGGMVQFGSGFDTTNGVTVTNPNLPGRITANTTGTSRGENVDLTIGGTNTFGTGTYFGGRGSSNGGNATVHFLKGSSTVFTNDAEVNFGGSSYAGRGGNALVYFDGGNTVFNHQNIYFGGNSKMGFGGTAEVYFEHTQVNFNQRVVFGGIGFLNAGYSEVTFGEGANTCFMWENHTESNYRGVYFSAMSYYDHEIPQCPDAYGKSGGTTVNFDCGRTTFNMLTVFGGSYDFDRIGGGDKDRTWGGRVEVNFRDGWANFIETTKTLAPNGTDRTWYRYEGGTYFGGPGSDVYVHFTGGQTAFVGDKNPDAARRNYLGALAERNGYDRFNSTNYADEVQFGGRSIYVGENIANGRIDGVDIITTVTAGNVSQYRSSTIVDMDCGRIYFDNVRATFGGRVGYYTRYDSMMTPEMYGNIGPEFFTDNNGDGQLDYHDKLRNRNWFNDVNDAATVNLRGGAELRIGTNALLVGLANGTSFNGDGGRIYFDYKLDNSLGLGAQGIDVGTIYFSNININSRTILDISIEQVQNLTVGTYQSDTAFLANSMNFNASGEINRFYTVSPYFIAGNERGIQVTVNRQLGFYESDKRDAKLGGVGNVGRNYRELNDIIYHHSEDAREVSNALKEILKRSNSVREDAENFDLLGGAIYANMAHAQIQRIWTMNQTLASQGWLARAGNMCCCGSCNSCCDPCGGGGCGYNCGGAYCGDSSCGQTVYGQSEYGGTEMAYDEYGNPYPVFNGGVIRSSRPRPQFTLWAAAFGYGGNVKYHNGFSGYDAESFGGIFGMQFGGERQLYGVYYSYGQTSVNSEASMGRAKIDSTDHTIGVYGKWFIPEYCAYVFASGNYFFGNNDSYRLFNQYSCTYRNEYTGDYNSHGYSLFLEKGWEWCFCCRWVLNPCRDPLFLDVDKMHYNSLRSAVGLRLAVDLLKCNPCHDLKLMTNIAWVHEWLEGQAVATTLPRAGTTGTSYGCPLNDQAPANLPKWRMYGNGGGITWVDFGLGLNYTYAQRVSFGVNYNLMANGYSAFHSGMASVGVKF